MRAFIGLSLLCLLVYPACQQETAYNFIQQGSASYYADLLAGKKTASGELYHPDSLTAAHLYLPLGTEVLVTNLKNKRQLRVRINDRGPYHKQRILDLSRKAADSLSFLREGITQVEIRAILPQATADSLNAYFFGS
ncbi:MAG: septal ring lytic transglycosylase RlpA family protein [Cyclobacteriaceae bacterium]